MILRKEYLDYLYDRRLRIKQEIDHLNSVKKFDSEKALSENCIKIGMMKIRQNIIDDIIHQYLFTHRGDL